MLPEGAPSPTMLSVGRTLSRWRGGRLLHPRGRSFTGQVELWGPFARQLAQGEGNWPATVRVSRGVPTPEGWPDVLGLAVRIPGDVGPVDLLVSSAGRLPILRHLPLPRRDFAGPYTSIVSYRLAGRRRLYLAALGEHPLGRTLETVVVAASRQQAVLRLAVATATGRWRPFGRVTFGELLSPATDAALAFDPVGNHPTNLLPCGVIQRLRDVAYSASRASRGAPDQADLP